MRLEEKCYFVELGHQFLKDQGNNSQVELRTNVLTSLDNAKGNIFRYFPEILRMLSDVIDNSSNQGQAGIERLKYLTLGVKCLHVTTT